MFFLFRFPTLNASHLKPFVYVSILPYLPGDVSLICRHKTKHYYSHFYNTGGAKADVPLNKKGAAPCWQWGSPTHETHRVACVTSVKNSQHLQTPHSPAVMLYIHSMTPPLQPESTYRRGNSKFSLILYFTHLNPYYCKVSKHRSRSK